MKWMHKPYDAESKQWGASLIPPKQQEHPIRKSFKKDWTVKYIRWKWSMEGKVEHLSRLDRSNCVPVFTGQINSGVSKCRPRRDFLTYQVDSGRTENPVGLWPSRTDWTPLQDLNVFFFEVGSNCLKKRKNCYRCVTDDITRVRLKIKSNYIEQVNVDPRYFNHWNHYLKIETNFPLQKIECMSIIMVIKR